MALIKGITIKLINLVEVGKDGFNQPLYSEVETLVNNVLVAPTSTDDVVNELNLSGKKAVYTLAIPKGDTNTWEGAYVEFFDKRFHVFTIPTQGIEALIPLGWNKKVMVEVYE